MMPTTHKNINASYRLDQAAFLNALAESDKGNMSRFLRRLLDESKEFQEWQSDGCEDDPHTMPR
jgi:hypothetical protein